MYNPTTILHKLLEIFPRKEFDELVLKYEADKYSKTFSTWNHFVTMFSAQAKGWNSLRELETGFKVYGSKLYHLGFGTAPKRSTISRVNADRPHEIYENFFYSVLEKLKGRFKVKKDLDFEIDKVIKIIDSSTVSLSIGLFDWARFRYNKGALKIHTSFNLTDQIPEFINLTNGKIADLEGINFNSYHDCILTFDRGYTDFDKLSTLHKNGVIFVARIKRGMNFKILGQHETKLPENILKDEIVILGSEKSHEKFPEKMRLITAIDSETGEVYRYYTNSMEYSAEVIVYIYRKRWEIELFFKWIKQNLKIKTFFGITVNAVKTQIWIAMIFYLILRYIQGKTTVKSILELTRVVREILFDSRDIFDLFSDGIRSNLERIDDDIGQLTLLTI